MTTVNTKTEANKVDTKIIEQLASIKLKRDEDYFYNIVLKNKKKPDILIKDLETHTDKYSCIIENKLKYDDLNKAKTQALEYAEFLLKEAKLTDIFIIIITDGITFNVVKYGIESSKIVYMNDISEIDSVKDLTLEFFIKHYQKEKKTKISETNQHNLKNVFDKINSKLREYGLSKDQRLHLTMSFLFLKLIKENSDLFEDKNKSEELENNIDNLKNNESETNIKNVFDSISRVFSNKFSFTIEEYMGRGILLELWKIIKEINLDNYDLDIKGEAFEYFINYGNIKSDIGEYFTPRHIVNFMIKLLDEEIKGRWLTSITGELNTYIDPTCGTGGFLISIFKKLLKEIEDNKDFLKTIKNKSVFGIELSRRTAEIAKMNMILAGDGHTNIANGDFLEYLKHDIKYNIAIGNMPFGKEIDEPQFVNGFLEIVKPGGYSIFIVPSGIIGTVAKKKYIKIREKLLTKGKLIKIVSLPGGVFAPYAGAQTYIILWKNEKQTEPYNIEFFNLLNDGYSLNDQREPLRGESDISLYINDKKSLIEKGQIFNVSADKVFDIEIYNKKILLYHELMKQINSNSDKIKEIQNQLKTIDNEKQKKQKRIRISDLKEEISDLKKRSDILSEYFNSIDFSLKFSKYDPNRKDDGGIDNLKTIKEITEEVKRGPFGSSIKKAYCVSEDEGEYRIYEQGNIIRDEYVTARYYITRERFERNLSIFEIRPDDILMSCAGTLGKVSLVPQKIKKGIFNSVLMRFRVKKEIVLPEYFKLVMQSKRMQILLDRDCIGVGIKNMIPTKEVLKIKIPIPKIEDQKKIIEEHKNIQKQIDKLNKKIIELQEQQFNIFGDF